MNTDFLKDILDGPGTKAKKRKRLRRYSLAIESMHSALAILHTWIKHDPANTTRDHILELIDGTLDAVAELEEQNRKDRDGIV